MMRHSGVIYLARGCGLGTSQLLWAGLQCGGEGGGGGGGLGRDGRALLFGLLALPSPELSPCRSLPKWSTRRFHKDSGVVGRDCVDFRQVEGVDRRRLLQLHLRSAYEGAADAGEHGWRR